MVRVRLAAIVVILASCALSSAAFASPWTLPDGTMTVRFGADLQYADHEFLISGERYPFSLDGSFRAANIRGELRFGLTDRTELGGSLSGGVVTYDADEVYLGDVLAPDVGEEGSVERFRANILSLDRARAGLGDLRVFVRHRVTPLGRAVAATEVELKLPTGYEPPDGTFEDDEFSQGVRDDVALGDGQADIDLQMLLGFAPTWDWFIRLDAGVRVRLFGPGQQAIGTFKTGVRLSTRVLPYVWVDGEHSFTEGRSIGVSYTTDAPSTPARDFTADLLVPTDVRLDRSHVQVGGGLIFSLDGQDLDVSYGYTPWGINVAQLHVISIGTTLSFIPGQERDR